MRAVVQRDRAGVRAPVAAERPLGVGLGAEAGDVRGDLDRPARVRREIAVADGAGGVARRDQLGGRAVLGVARGARRLLAARGVLGDRVAA
jgi:hypothetical protein